MQRQLLFAVALFMVMGCSSSVNDSAKPSDSQEDPPSPSPSSSTPPSSQPPPPPPRDVPPGYRDALREAITTVDGSTGLGPDLKVDTGALEQRVLGLLSTGGKDLTTGFNLGVQAIVDAYPVGHLAIYPNDPATTCGTADLPVPTTSVIGACTQPFGDHAVVTTTKTGSNPLGLTPGDEILGIDDKRGQAMLDETLARPMCQTGISSASSRRARAATSIFAGVKVGSTVTIKHVADGTVETKTITSIAGRREEQDCNDPFGRDGDYAAKATSLPVSGAAVIHIPRFYPKNGWSSTPLVDLANLQAAIKSEFDKVKSAPYLIIDVRGNRGGATPIAMAIAAGMPGAALSTLQATCKARVPYTTTYNQDFDYKLEPSTDFLTTAKVAILVDGNSISATDYFTHTVRTSTGSYVVGRPNAGAYGGSTNGVKIDKGPGLIVLPDPWRCTDAEGKLLEGQSVKLDADQDLKPADLARGVDTDVQAAIDLLTQETPTAR